MWCPIPRRLVAGLVATLMVVAGLVAVPARADAPIPISSRQIDTLLCTDLLFVGVRGSGEKAPYGQTITEIQKTLFDRWKGSSTSVYVDYPALSPHTITQQQIEGMLLNEEPTSQVPYFESVAEGAQQLEHVLQVSSTRCPQQRIVLAGFSQGAQVITTVLATSPHAHAVTASLLLGNPSHYPGQSARELDGQVDSPAMGLFSMLDFLRSRTHTEPSDTRQASVRLLLSDVFELYEGHVTSAEIAATLGSSDSVMPATAYPNTFSVCQKDDMVCDAAPALSRVLASSSTLEDEFARTRPVHNFYTPAVALRSLEAILGLLADTGRVIEIEGESPRPPVLTPAPSSASPSGPITPRVRPTTAPVPVPRRGVDARWWLLTGGVALVATGLGFVAGRRGRRGAHEEVDDDEA